MMILKAAVWRVLCPLLEMMVWVVYDLVGLKCLVGTARFLAITCLQQWYCKHYVMKQLLFVLNWNVKSRRAVTTFLALFKII